MIIGCHVQMKAPLYLEGSVNEALSYGANTMMFYTGAPQNTKRIALDQLHIREALDTAEKAGMHPENWIVHAPYVLNMANTVKEDVADFSREFFQQELIRAQAMHARIVVLHPGAYTQGTLETSMKMLTVQLNLLKIPEGMHIALETMAGKGTEIGSSFEQLADILEHLQDKEKFGVCLDTCHINDAGYNVQDFNVVWDHFEEVIGKERLFVIHLNDSKNACGSHKDRHANIGKGTIGLEVLRSIAQRPAFADIPMILETPYIDDKPPYKEEISQLRALPQETSEFLQSRHL